MVAIANETPSVVYDYCISGFLGLYYFGGPIPTLAAPRIEDYSVRIPIWEWPPRASGSECHFEHGGTVARLIFVNPMPML
jgi:hypothetical protein